MSCALLLAALVGGGRTVGASVDDAGQRAAGAALFHERGCEHCHGADGVGTEQGPSLTTVGKKLKPEQIGQQIIAGGGGMPAFGDALQPDETAALVAWLRTKRKAPKTARRATGLPPSPAASSADTPVP